MKTQIAKIEDIKKDYDKIIKAAQIIKKGEIVAIPTETVYGLAANIFDTEAAKKIFIAKGRPQDNPLIAHISDFSQIYDICENISENGIKLAKEFWPGPLTMIFHKKECVPDTITGGLSTVAVRYPSHIVANAIIKEAKVPLVAPSANLSGKPSTTSAQHCIRDLSGKIPYIVDYGECEYGLESTIIDTTVTPEVILRPGAITIEQIKKVIPNVIGASNSLLHDNEVPKAPGMKYRHYAPNAEVIVISGNPKDTAKFIKENAKQDDGILCFEEYKEYFKSNDKVLLFGSYKDSKTNGNRLFNSLRKFDEIFVKRIFIQCPEDKGIGIAIINRLNKASGRKYY